MFRGESLLPFIAVSSLCILVLLGGYVYSGSLLPSTRWSSDIGAIAIWVFWTACVLFPILTVVLVVRNVYLRRKL